MPARVPKSRLFRVTNAAQTRAFLKRNTRASRVGTKTVAAARRLIAQASKKRANRPKVGRLTVGLMKNSFRQDSMTSAGFRRKKPVKTLGKRNVNHARADLALFKLYGGQTVPALSRRIGSVRASRRKGKRRPAPRAPLTRRRRRRAY